MTANPNPDEISAIFNREYSVSKSHAGRPKRADLLKMERRMSGVCDESAEILSRNPLNRLRESLKASPEAGGCAVHLKILEVALFFGFKGFGNQEI